jgi:hypothetical protein
MPLLKNHAMKVCKEVEIGGHSHLHPKNMPCHGDKKFHLPWFIFFLLDNLDVPKSVTRRGQGVA